MPELFIYLFKVNAVLVIFYLAYRFILRPLTFYRVNRAFLLFGILFSSLYPLANLSAFWQNNPEIGQKIVVLVPDWRAYTALVTVVKPDMGFTWYSLAEIVFWSGVVLLALRFIVRLASIYRLHRRSVPGKWNAYTFRNSPDAGNPFAFLRTIYLNTEKLNGVDLKTVLSHEKVHADELHTIDMLVSELSTIFYWFNPGAWLTKVAVKENLEFITDQKVLSAGADSRAYQYDLLRMTTLRGSSPLVNHFNLLTLKHRIIMMNKKRSSALQATKYVLIVPVVTLLACVFTVSRAQIESTGRKIATLLEPLPAFAAVSADVKAPERAESAESPAILTKPVAFAAVPVAPSAHFAGVADTVRYMLNGKAVKDINTIDPEDIASVYVLKGEQAVRALGDDYVKGVIIVTTKGAENNEEVRKLSEKISSLRVYAVAGNTVAATRPGTISAARPGAATTVTDSVRARTNNELVVQGYQSSARTITNEPVTVAAVSGQARAARSLTPVTVTGYGQSGAQQSITLVGQNPLILIDGVEAPLERYSDLDTKTIESIDILKSNSGVATYGPKAANGVILIRTKKKKN